MGTQFRLASVFSDHMVLSRNHPIRLFGEAESGTRIMATLNGSTASATAREHRFEIVLPPMTAEGPHILTVTCGDETLAFYDVMIGEVYLAGGQSNMELELQNADDGKRLVAEANHPDIRFYNVPKQPWLDAAARAAERATRWHVVTPGACAELSAVAYHFAVRLQAAHGVPVGIIDCYWGGTSIACWLEEAALRLTTAGNDLLEAYAARIAGKTDEQFDMESKAHDDAFQAWCNRVDALKAQHPDLPMPQINELAGACPWGPPIGRKSPFRPAGLAETMVKRVAPYTLTGILYYQGEEDTSHPELYLPLMMTLVPYWRGLFRDDALPFLFAQLPMFIAANEVDDKRWAVLRHAQECAHKALRNTGLAVLIDCGEFDNIHPTDKQTVGERLYWQTEKVACGNADAPDSPRALYVLREGDAILVTLDTPVRVVGEQAQPALLEVAGADGVFHPATANIGGNTLRLTAEGVQEPVEARYAWVNYGKVNLFGEVGLPLAPFWLK